MFDLTVLTGLTGLTGLTEVSVSTVNVTTAPGPEPTAMSTAEGAPGLCLAALVSDS
jgi:hypothetical protein